MTDHLIRAAGGVVWRNNDLTADSPSIEVAIVHRPRYGDWSLPKGKLAPAESTVEAAIREVFEETGYRVRLGRYLGEVHYMKLGGGVERPKVVYYWSMMADGGLFTPTQEVDGLRWLDVPTARTMLTRDTDRQILDLFEAGPILAHTVLLVRHASAGSRSKWSDEDHLRPLDEVGFEQAEQLVRLLSRFGVARICSADYVRCTQTVEPLGEAVGVEIEPQPLLSEVGYPGNEDAALAFIRTAGTASGALALCTQGDVVPDVLKRLAKEDDFDLPGDFEYKKASTWALTFDEERLRAAEYFPPPAVEL